MARLTLKDRRLLARMYRDETPTITIAQKLNCSQATIYNELERGFTGKVDEYGRREYDPGVAQRAIREATRRQGRRAKETGSMRRDC